MLFFFFQSVLKISIIHFWNILYSLLIVVFILFFAVILYNFDNKNVISYIYPLNIMISNIIGNNKYIIIWIATKGI